MSNSLTVSVTFDGHRNAGIRVSGVADTSDITAVSAIPLSLFTNNDPRLTFNGFNIMEVDYTGTPGLLVALDWNGNTPQNFGEFSTSFNSNDRSTGGNTPDTTRGGYDGTLNVSTRGFTPGYVYGFTLMLAMLKLYAP